MGSIIDNRNRKMVDVLKDRLKDAEEIDIATAFFYFSGFNLIAEDLKDKKVRILVGMILEPDVSSIMQLCKEIKINKDTPLSHYAMRGYPALTKYLKRENYINGFASLVNQSFMSPYFDYSDSKDALDIFLGKVKDGSLEIKLNAKEDDHAKYYVITYKDSGKSDLIEGFTPKGTVIEGSSNFTYGGLCGNGELNEEISEYSGEKYDEYKERFDKAWNDLQTTDICVDSDDNNTRFIEDVKKKLSVYSLPSPFQLYLRILDEYYSTTVKDDIRTPSTISHKHYVNLKYQLDAIKYGIDCINNNNGVIIADVVGLGKSIIASAIANNLDYDNTIIICPPHLVDQWQEYVSEFSLRGASVHSSGKLDSLYDELSRNRYVPGQKVLFIIDEAHRYRNEESVSYQYLHQIVRFNPESKVMLLTATPYNNRPQDIFALIKLFQTPSKSTINSVDNLDVEFHRLITRYNTLQKEGKKKEGDAARKELSELGAQLRNLIDPVVIRRSRIDLQKIDVYRDDLNTQHILFPKVVGPELIEYDLGEIEGIYIETLQMINDQLLCARYDQTSYLIDPDKFLIDYGDMFSEKDITVSQKNLAEFIKRLLVMRFESSKIAFKKTLTNILNSYEIMVKWWEKGYVPIALRGGSQVDDPTDFDEDDIDQLLFEDENVDDPDNSEISKKKKKYYLFDRSLFNDDYIKSIKKDIDLLSSIHNMWFASDELGEDPKYERIVRQIKSLIDEYPTRKIIIFSSFSDTAEYVADRLKKDGFRALLYTGKSSDTDRKRVKQNFDASYDEGEPKNDYDILVATDAISEGFNLNRAGVVINYDIPYNPTRVIQRIGRINRINKKMFDELYIFNCFPTEVGEENTLVKGISTLKMLLIYNVVGSDTRTLTPDEDLTSYFKRQYDEASREEDPESWDIEFRNTYDKYKDNTVIMNEVREIPTRSRILRKNQKDSLAIAYLKKGDRELFVTIDEDNKPRTLHADEALNYFKADEKEEAYELEKRFDNDLRVFNDFVERPETRTKNDVTKNRALDNIRLLRELCPGEANYLDDLLDTIDKYDDLSDGELRNISRLKCNTLERAQESIKVLKEEIPVQYINSIKMRVEQLDSDIETIIFTEELEK